MIQRVMIASLIVFTLLLIGCTETPQMSAKDFYLRSLNLDRFPSDVSDFAGDGFDAFPEFISDGYFKYKAQQSYFQMLTQHRKFSRASEFNQQIHLVKCDGPEMPESFSHWTKEMIDRKDKSCFVGTFVPYVHYIIHDPRTSLAHHFITGMRE